MSKAIVANILCPYCDIEINVCKASYSSMKIDEQLRIKYCGNDNYDYCPTFLVKNLISKDDS